jgi:hypothetical protein
MNNGSRLIDELLNIKIRYRDLSVQHWLNYELFTWVWWLGIFSTIVPLIVWWKVVDRKRILELTVLGLIVNVSATFLDIFGSEFALWEYRIRILPHIPLLFPVDSIVLPVINMLIYQSFPKWKKFLIANTIAAAGMAFIIEPFVVLIGQYKLINWQYIYSFPIYIIICVFSKIVTERIISLKTASEEEE